MPYSIFSILSGYIPSLPDEKGRIKPLIELLKRRRFETDVTDKIAVITFDKSGDGLPELLANLLTQLANTLDDLAREARGA